MSAGDEQHYRSSGDDTYSNAEVENLNMKSFYTNKMNVTNTLQTPTFQIRKNVIFKTSVILQLVEQIRTLEHVKTFVAMDCVDSYRSDLALSDITFQNPVTQISLGRTEFKSVSIQSCFSMAYTTEVEGNYV
jgi:hypothetical protein